MARIILPILVLSLAACTYPPNVLVATPVAIPSADPMPWVEGALLVGGPWRSESDSPIVGPRAAASVPLGRGFGFIASGGTASDGVFVGSQRALSQQNAEVAVTYSAVRADLRVTALAGVGRGRVSDRTGSDIVATQNRQFVQISVGKEAYRRLSPLVPVEFAAGGLFIRAERVALGSITRNEEPREGRVTGVLQPGVYLEGGEGPLSWSLQIGGTAVLKSLWPSYVAGGFYVAPALRYRL